MRLGGKLEYGSCSHLNVENYMARICIYLFDSLLFGPRFIDRILRSCGPIYPVTWHIIFIQRSRGGDEGK